MPLMKNKTKKPAGASITRGSVKPPSAIEGSKIATVRELPDGKPPEVSKSSPRFVVRELSNAGPSSFRTFESRRARELNFADHFTSPTLTVLVGPMGTAFYLHKKCLTDRSPYFAGLLNFSGSESKTNTVTLNDPVDSLDAFRMFVDYLYHDTYTIPIELKTDARCILHTRVYVLAKRLLMEPLKTLALEKMVVELAGAYRIGGGFSWPVLDNSLDVDTVVEMVEFVYENTEDTYSEDEVSQKSEERSEVNKNGDAGHSSKGKERELRFEGHPLPSPPLPPDGEEAVPEYGREAVADEEPTAEYREETVAASESVSERGEEAVPIEDAETTVNIGDDPLPPRDRMRKLVSRYAASHLTMLNRKAKFRELVRGCGEFAEDVILAAEKGNQIKSDELGRL